MVNLHTQVFDAPWPSYLHFHAVFKKFVQIIGWRLLPFWVGVRWEILDPPLRLPDDTFRFISELPAVH